MLAAAVDETSIGRLIYVDDTGSDAGSGAANSPLGTLARAVDIAVAPGGPLAQGIATKIVVRNGFYVDQPAAGVWTDQNDFPVWPGQSADTPLIIEGESDTNSVIFSGVRNDYRQLVFEGKNNLVLRNLTFENLVSNPFGTDNWGAIHLSANPDDINGDGRFGPNRGHDVLLDNIQVTGSDRPGAYLLHYDDVTIVDSTFDNNLNPVGLHFKFINDALVEDTSISANGTPGAELQDNNFGNGGFLFAANNTTLRRVRANDNFESSGLRMDFMAQNVTVQDSEFLSNRIYGLQFETSLGPVTIDNVKMNNNDRGGINIATTDDLTIRNSEIIGNDYAGVVVTEQIRDERNFSPPTFLWAQDPNYYVTNFKTPGGNVIGGIPSAWNTRTVIENTTIDAIDALGFIIASDYDKAGQWQNHYDQWVADEIVGSNNTLRAVRDDAFLISTSSGSPTTVDFATWQTTSGTDATSTFNEPVDDGSGDGNPGAGDQTTFGNDGNPWQISVGATTRIEAENFDSGGQGVSYRENSPPDFAGSGYRPDAPGVDVAASNIGWFENGEWLEYTIDVEQAGPHTLALRLARSGGGGGYNVSVVGGDSLTGDQVLGSTGGWGAYQVRQFDVNLSAGEQVLRMTRTDGSGLNFDYFELTPQAIDEPPVPPSDPPAVQTTFGNGGEAWPIGLFGSVRIEAENFDVGGQGVSYNETTPQDFAGSGRRPDAPGVDVSNTVVGWFDGGEWLEYTVDVSEAGLHRLRLNMARDGGGATYDVSLVDDSSAVVSLTGNQSYAGTGGWGNFESVDAEVMLPAGRQVIRFTNTANGGINLNWLELERVATPPVTDPPVSDPPIGPVELSNASFEQAFAQWGVEGNVAVGSWAGTSDGNLAVALGSGNRANDGVVQRNFSTTAGARYRVTFDYRVDGRSDRTQSLRASATAGAVLGGVTASGSGGSGYQSWSFEFEATGATTTLRFEDVSGVTNAIDGWLDNVRVQVI